MARVVAALLLAGSTLTATVAHADRPLCTDVPPDAEVRRRLAALSQLVRDHEPPVRRWYTSFALLHGGMLSGAVILGATAETEQTRNVMIVGSIGSALALTTLVIFTPPLMGAGDTLADLPEDSPEARLHKMRVAEDLLRRASSGVDFLHGWFPATLSTLYVAAMSQALLLGFEQPEAAIGHAAGGLVLGLGRILLRPTGARDAWRRYARAFPDAGCEEPTVPTSPETSWRFAPFGGGLGFEINF